MDVKGERERYTQLNVELQRIARREKQEYWSGLPFPSPVDLPDPGIEPRFPASEADSLPSEPPGICYL